MTRNAHDEEVIAVGLRDTSDAPKGRDVYYRCRKCGTLIPSVPKDNVGCDCGNIFIDVDYFRLAVRELGQFEAVRRPRKR
jgi:hypothetical protein